MASSFSIFSGEQRWVFAISMNIRRPSGMVATMSGMTSPTTNSGWISVRSTDRSGDTSTGLPSIPGVDVAGRVTRQCLAMISFARIWRAVSPDDTQSTTLSSGRWAKEYARSSGSPPFLAIIRLPHPKQTHPQSPPLATSVIRRGNPSLTSFATRIMPSWSGNRSAMVAFVAMWALNRFGCERLAREPGFRKWTRSSTWMRRTKGLHIVSNHLRRTLCFH